MEDDAVVRMLVREASTILPDLEGLLWVTLSSGAPAAAYTVLRDADGRETRRQAVPITLAIGEAVAAYASACFRRLPQEAGLSLLTLARDGHIELVVFVDPVREIASLGYVNARDLTQAVLVATQLQPEQIH